MAFRALIYLQCPSETTASYIGEKELSDRPVRNAEIAFEHRGETVTGRVEVILPEDWFSRGAVPMVTVVQNADA